MTKASDNGPGESPWDNRRTLGQPDVSSNELLLQQALHIAAEIERRIQAVLRALGNPPGDVGAEDPTSQRVHEPPQQAADSARMHEQMNRIAQVTDLLVARTAGLAQTA